MGEDKDEEKRIVEELEKLRDDLNNIIEKFKMRKEKLEDVKDIETNSSLEYARVLTKMTAILVFLTFVMVIDVGIRIANQYGFIGFAFVVIAGFIVVILTLREGLMRRQ